jgi:cyanophycinase
LLMRTQEQQARVGKLVIIGGAEDKTGEMTILKRVAHEVGAGKLTIMTLASDEQKEKFERYEACFARLEITNPYHLHSGISHREGRKMLEESSFLFITGGNQFKAKEELAEKDLDTQVIDFYEDGRGLGGTSAGASLFSERIIPDLREGLRLVPETIIDQHFSKRNRLPRLENAVTVHPHMIGLGIDEDTAVIKHGDMLTTVGCGTVTVVWFDEYEKTARHVVKSSQTVFDLEEFRKKHSRVSNGLHLAAD